MSQPVLSLDGLTKSYGALQATNDVSLAVAAGEIHALIGPPLSVRSMARRRQTAASSVSAAR